MTPRFQTPAWKCASRAMTLGVTLSAPDRVSYTREDLAARIRVALGGRVAEEVVYGQITTGAESDIQQLTQIARQMVGRWGMSDAIGSIAVLPQDGSGPLVPSCGSATSADTEKLVETEVRRLVSDAQANVTQLLIERERASNARLGASQWIARARVASSRASCV